MASIDWKQRFMRNSLSGLVSTALSLICALVMFRTLYSTWSAPQFGFWALMWSLFGLGFVLDLGIGLSVQRAVAQKIGKGDMAALNRLMSTAFWGFAGISVLIVAVMMMLREPFLILVKVPPAEHSEFARAYTIFAVMLALIFPLGLFSEMLHGIQRIDLTNWIHTAAVAINFGCIMVALHLGWSFSSIVTIGTLFSVLPNIAFALMAFRYLPGLSVHPRHFSPPDLRAQIGFSISAYFVSVSNKVLEQSDRIIIGTVLGVAHVAVYQAAAKVSEILRLFAQHLGTVVSPAAAHLHADDDRDGLSELLLRTSKFNFLLVTPVYILAAVYLDAVLMALTGLEEISGEMWLLGQFLLFAVYHAQIAGVCAGRVLIMSGHERVLLKFTILQAATNVALSLMLVLPYRSVGVALATLLCSVGFSWGLILPKILRSLGVRFSDFARFHLRDALPLLACFSAVLGILLFAFPLAQGAGLFALLWRGAAVMLPTLIASFPVLRTTWAN